MLQPQPGFVGAEEVPENIFQPVGIGVQANLVAAAVFQGAYALQIRLAQVFHRQKQALGRGKSANVVGALQWVLNILKQRAGYQSKDGEYDKPPHPLAVCSEPLEQPYHQGNAHEYPGKLQPGDPGLPLDERGEKSPGSPQSKRVSSERPVAFPEGKRCCQAKHEKIGERAGFVFAGHFSVGDVEKVPLFGEAGVGRV